MSYILERLGNSFEILSGFPFDSSLFNEEGNGLPLIRVRDVNNGYSGQYYSGEYDESYVINNGDLLISLDGDFNCLKWTNGKALLNQRVCKLIPNDNKIIKDYALHYLPAELLKIHRNTNFTTVKHLSVKTISEIKIPLRPLTDQIKIATVLSKAEALIKQRKENINLLDDFLKVLFLKMFGDPVKNKLSWPIKNFGQCLSQILSGSSSTNKTPDNFENSREAKILKVSAVSWGEFNPQEFKIINWSQLGNKLVNPQEGDLLFSRANTRELVGATCIVDKNYPDLFLPDKLWVLFLNKEVNQYYIHFLFQDIRFKKILTKDATGSSGSMLNISMEKLREINIPVPAIESQNEFKKIVINAWTLKKQFKSSLDDLENLYASLSHKAFSFKDKLPPYFLGSDNFSDPDNMDHNLGDSVYLSSELTKEWEKIICRIAKEDFLKGKPNLFHKEFENIGYADDGYWLKRTYDRYYGPQKLIPKKELKVNKVEWETISIQEVSNWIIEKYSGLNFSSEMLLRFLQEEQLTQPYYFSSEELKKFPKFNSLDDLHTLIFSALTNENPYLKLKQVFYNGTEKSFALNLSEEDIELTNGRNDEQMSGIYFTIE